MGLDMYVTIRHKDTQSKLDAYEAWEQKYTCEEFERLTPEQQDEYWKSKPEHDAEMYGNELMYWRKANQIHNWFVKNCQDGVDDCGRYAITVADLKKLKELCEKILTMTEIKQELRPTYPNGWFSEPVHVMEDVRLLTEEGMKFASEHLPSRSGFFFGSTDYDDNYVWDLENTIEQIDGAIYSLNCEYGFSLNSDYIIEYSASW